MYTKFSLTIIVINDFELSCAWQKCATSLFKLTLRAIKLNSTATEANKRFSGGNEVDQLKMNLEHKKGHSSIENKGKP